MSLTRICSITKQSFTISEAEIAFCESNSIPLPIIAPYERLKQMLYFDNATHLYNGTCALSGKPMLSIIPPHKGYKAYDIDAWNSDSWDATVYGRDYDFLRPFFEQFGNLMKEAPMPSRQVMHTTVENSDYCNGITNAKNCYLIFNSTNNEDCLFSRQLFNCKNVIESLNTLESELCYSCKHVKNCYNLKFSESCDHCHDSAFLFGCKSVKNCYGCTNLSNKEYCWYNHQLTREQFEVRSAQLNLGSREVLEKEQEKFNNFKAQTFQKDVSGYLNENSTGNYINECKNCTSCFFTIKAEDVEYGIRTNKSKNCFVYAYFGNGAELIYNCQTCGNNAYNLKFCLGCFPQNKDLEYCIYSRQSENCFGCVAIKQKQYCILNKQYQKEEYFALLKRIKEHMLSTGEYGQFFPTQLSPFDYNHSEAMHFFPLNKPEALAQGFRWEDEAVEIVDNTYAIPDHIKDVLDSILKTTLTCTLSGKKYRIIKQELEAYRAMNVPIPTVSPLERMQRLCQSVALSPLVQTICKNCNKAITTVYANELVYCESCYQSMIA